MNLGRFNGALWELKEEFDSCAVLTHLEELLEALQHLRWGGMRAVTTCQELYRKAVL